MDSKYLFATANTKGVKIFNTNDGTLVSDINTPGIQRKQVELSYSNTRFIVVTEEKEKQCAMRFYDTKKALEWGKKEGNLDHEF